MKLPPPLKQLYALWMKFSHAFGRVMSFLILTILWIVGFGTYGIIIRTIGLFRKEGKKDSYWLDVPHSPQDSLRHQF